MKSSNSKINKLEISLLEENSRVINNLKKLSVSKSKKEFNESNNVIDVKYTDTTYNDNLYWNEFSSSMEIRINKSNDVQVGKSDDIIVGNSINEPNGKNDEQVGNCNDDEHVGNSTNDVIVSNCTNDVIVGNSTNDVIVGNCNEHVGNSTTDVIVCNCNEHVGNSTNEPIGNSTNEPIGNCTNEPIGNSTNEPIGNCTNEPIGNCTNEQVGKNYYFDKNKVLQNICIECSNVCYRGEGEITNDDSIIIELPYCVKKLYTDLTIQLTPIYNGDKSNITLYTSNIEDNKFTVYATKNVKFYWMVYGKYCNINNEIKDLDLIVNNFL